MNIGFSIALGAIPFFDLLSREERALAAEALKAEDERAVASAMDATRRRLAHGVEAFVRSLSAVARNDANVARSSAYALVGLADERMLHYPSGGLGRWREKLLEFELYGSALAGQEIVRQAQASVKGGGPMAEGGEASLLAPLYLAVFREGFEGSLRGDVLGLSSLIGTLEDSLGANRDRPVEIVGDVGPSRPGVQPISMALAGLALWLFSGFAIWLVLPGDALRDADRIAERVAAGLPVGDGVFAPLQRSIGPSRLLFPQPSSRDPADRDSREAALNSPPREDSRGAAPASAQ